MKVRAAAILTATALCAGCHAPLNYLAPDAPRYAGELASAPPPDASRPLFVTFNLRYARHLDSAIALFESEPSLRDADLILLQEMDAPGYQWPTEFGPRTTVLGRWDHFFLRGFIAVSGTQAGTVRGNRGVSDHRPVWTVAAVSAAADAAPASRP